jgi:hypothetical protein
MLQIRSDGAPAELEKLTIREQEAILAAYMGISGNQLQPAETATTVQVHDGKALITDGLPVDSAGGARRLLPLRGRPTVAWATAYADEFAEVLALLADGALQVADQTSEIASIDGGPYRFRAATRSERHEDPRRTERSVIPTTAGSCGSSHDFTSGLSTIRSRAHRSDENRRNVQHLGARADARGAEGRDALAKTKAGLVLFVAAHLLFAKAGPWSGRYPWDRRGDGVAFPVHAFAQMRVPECGSAARLLRTRSRGAASQCWSSTRAALRRSTTRGRPEPRHFVSG